MNTIHKLLQSFEKAQELSDPSSVGTGCEECLRTGVCAGVMLLGVWGKFEKWLNLKIPYSSIYFWATTQIED